MNPNDKDSRQQTADSRQQTADIYACLQLV